MGNRDAAAGGSRDGDFRISGKVLPVVDHGFSLWRADQCLGADPCDLTHRTPLVRCRKIIGFSVIEFSRTDGVPVYRPAFIGSDRCNRTVLRRDGPLCRQRDVIREGMPGVAPAEITDRPSVGTLGFQPVFACNGIGAQIVDLHLQTVLIAGKSGRKQRIANGLSVEGYPVDADTGDGKRQCGLIAAGAERAGENGAGTVPEVLCRADSFCI